MNSAKLAQKAYLLAMGSDGFSINLNGDSPKEGYMVSRIGMELRAHNDLFSEKLLKAYFVLCRDILKQHPQAYFGGWKDGDVWYLDISENVFNLESALTLGLVRNQISIFDLSTFEAIYCKPEIEAVTE